MNEFFAAILGAIIGGIGSWVGNMAGAKEAYEYSVKDRIEENRLLLLNQLKYSVDIMKGKTDDAMTEAKLVVVKRDTLFIEKNCEVSMRYLKLLSSTDKKIIVEWLQLLHDFEKWMEFKGVNVLINKDPNMGKLKDDIRGYIPKIEKIIDKLQDS